MKKDIKTTIVIIAFAFGVIGFSSAKSEVSKKLNQYTSFMSKTQINY